MSIFDGNTSDDALPDFVKDEAPEAVEEAPQETLPVLPIDAPVAEEAPEEVQEAPEAPRVWAGKYRDPEQLEKGYREIRDLQRRTAERAKAYEQRAMEVESQIGQYKQALQQAIPLVQQAVAAQQQRQQQQQQDPYAEPQPLPQPVGLQPQQVVPLVDRIVQQRLQQVQGKLNQQQAQQAEYAEARETVGAFFESHPEVLREGPIDQDITDTILALNQAWAAKDGSSVNIGNTESLEIAYEAAKNPALRRVLEMNPEYIEDDEGMILARQAAAAINAQSSTQAESPPAPARTAAPRANTPFVERGSAQAPQPGSPLDEFDQAANEYRNLQRRGGDSVFF